MQLQEKNISKRRWHLSRSLELFDGRWTKEQTGDSRWLIEKMNIIVCVKQYMNGISEKCGWKAVATSWKRSQYQPSGYRLQELGHVLANYSPLATSGLMPVFGRPMGAGGIYLLHIYITSKHLQSIPMIKNTKVEPKLNEILPSSQK